MILWWDYSWFVYRLDLKVTLVCSVTMQPYEEYWSKELVQQGLKRGELIQVCTVYVIQQTSNNQHSLILWHESVTPLQDCHLFHWLGQLARYTGLHLAIHRTTLSHPVLVTVTTLTHFNWCKLIGQQESTQPFGFHPSGEPSHLPCPFCSHRTSDNTRSGFEMHTCIIGLRNS